MTCTEANTLSKWAGDHNKQGRFLHFTWSPYFIKYTVRHCVGHGEVISTHGNTVYVYLMRGLMRNTAFQGHRLNAERLPLWVMCHSVGDGADCWTHLKSSHYHLVF